MRKLLFVLIAGMCFTPAASAQIRQTTLYIDNDEGAFTLLTAPNGPGTIIFPAGGTLATTSDLSAYLPLAGGTMTAPGGGGTGINLNGTNLYSGGYLQAGTALGTSEPIKGGYYSDNTVVAAGTINGDGSVHTQIGAWGVTHTGNTGFYVITLPYAVASPIVTTTTWGSNTLCYTPDVYQSGSTTIIDVQTTVATNGHVVDQPFSFIVIGPHP
jgi:hypothetical protein